MFTPLGSSLEFIPGRHLVMCSGIICQLFLVFRDFHIFDEYKPFTLYNFPQFLLIWLYTHTHTHTHTHIWFGSLFTLESESEYHSVMFDFLQPHGLHTPWNSPGQNTGVGSLSLLQGNNIGSFHYWYELWSFSFQFLHWKALFSFLN